MINFKQKSKAWWLIGLAGLLAAYGAVGCGKKSDGGPAIQNPGLIGVTNNCGPFGCFGATAGQQITRAVGSLNYDDNLDNTMNPSMGRLMDLSLNINMWQSNYNMGMGGIGGLGSMGLNYPMSNGGYTYPASTQLAYYTGPVQVSGQLSVISPIQGCNITPGNFNVQALQVGQLMMGTLTVMLGVNVNGGQGFTINLQNLNVMPGGMGPIGPTVGTQPMSSSQSRLMGVVSIHECGDVTFKVN